MNIKNRLVPLFCGATALVTFALWNTDATAQSGPGGDTGAKLPFNRKCTVTLDARSNARSSMTQEMQQQSGFVRQDTVEGTLISADAEWLVLKSDNTENWIPRDKILLLRAEQ